MDRNFLQNLSNLTGLPMAQLLEKLGRINEVDNPFEKADADRIPRVGTARGGGATGGNASNVGVSGNGLSAGAAGGGPLPSTTGNGSGAGGQNAVKMQVGNGLSAGAANGGPLPSTTPIRSNTMTGNGSGAGGKNAVSMQVGNGLSAGAANGGPLPSTTGNATGAAAASPRGGGGSQAYQLGGVKEGFWGGVNQLASANNISNPNQLSVGQQLKMPDGSTYTVRGGDTLSGIYQNRAAAAQAAPAPAAAPAAAPAPASAAAPAAAAPASFGRVGASQASATSNPYAAGGGNNGPGFAQNQRDPNAPAVTASPPTTGTTGVGGELLQPGLGRNQAVTPATTPVSTPAPIDPMTNGERRQGNQFIASSPYEETASPPPEVAAPRPGGSVYSPGTSEKTDGLSPDTNPYPYGQAKYPHSPYSPTSTDQPTNPFEILPSREADDSRSFVQESQRMAPPDLTRSMKKKGSWFSSATHPVIRGY